MECRTTQDPREGARGGAFPSCSRGTSGGAKQGKEGKDFFAACCAEKSLVSASSPPSQDKLQGESQFCRSPPLCKLKIPTKNPRCPLRASDYIGKLAFLCLSSVLQTQECGSSFSENLGGLPPFHKEAESSRNGKRVM